MSNDNVIETPAKPTRIVEYYEAGNANWYWRVRNIKNKKITMTGAEGYNSKAAVLRAIKQETKNWQAGTFNGPNETEY